jgi:hypothetical protein
MWGEKGMDIGQDIWWKGDFMDMFHKGNMGWKDMDWTCGRKDM